MADVICIEEARIWDHLGEMVRRTVGEMLNAAADRLCGAARYERSEARRDTRSGSCEQAVHAKSGKVTLKVPRLSRQTSRRRSSGGRVRSRRP